jgi:hypothetical protein
MAFDVDKPQPETCANFALMEVRPGAMERYWRLAVETLEYQKRLKAAEIFNYPTWISVGEATTVGRYLARQIPQEHHDVGLFSRWEDWASEYEEIYQASPKWRLKEMISQVSETHHFSSWPNRWEQEIWKWAMSDEGEQVCPFDDRKGIIDPEFRQRLRALIEEVGGFLYRCEESRQIVFAPAEDLEKIWRHQDHLSEIDRNKRFGFFYDATCPNFAMRAPTEEEERLMSIIRHRSLAQKGWRARLVHFLKHLGR